MTTIFKAVITDETDYEQDLNDQHAEYGADKNVLIERMKAACAELAPLDKWTVLVDGAYGFVAHITIGDHTHYAGCQDVELVC